MSTNAAEWTAAVGGWAGAAAAAAAVWWAVRETKRRDEREARGDRRRRNRALAAVVSDLDALDEFIDEKLPETNSRFPHFELISLAGAIEHLAALPPECTRSLLRVQHRLAAYNAAAADHRPNVNQSRPSLTHRRGQALQAEVRVARDLLGQHVLADGGQGL